MRRGAGGALHRRARHCASRWLADAAYTGQQTCHGGKANLRVLISVGGGALGEMYFCN